MIARRVNPLVLILMVIAAHASSQDVAIRVMTFNVEDVRHAEASGPGDERLVRLAEVIQRVRPNVLLLNEIELFQGTGQHKTTAQHFIENYLMVPQSTGLEPIGYTSLRLGSNTGIPSGVDLDGSGTIDASVPERTSQQSSKQRAYGADCYGFGTFPGQYAMSLLVDPRLEINQDGIRSFQEFLWKDLEGGHGPTNPDGSAYYSDEAWDIFRLASKNFVDVPIVMPSGAVVHALVSHPTPPAFDGSEMKNKHRNRDEIRLIRAYIDGDESLYDDVGIHGGLEEGASFVVLGDLNADPVDGSSIGDPIDEFLFASDWIYEDIAPRSEIDVDRLDATDTASFGLRVDYVLPSSDLRVLDSGIWRFGTDDPDRFASDHFPVWVDLVVPAP